jgi:predicted nucleic acid-binding protein
MKADLVLLDEKKARKSAIIAGFEVIGPLDLFLVANNLGLLKEIRSSWVSYLLPIPL